MSNISTDLIPGIARHIIKKSYQELSIDHISNEVSREFGIEADMLRSTSQKREITEPRQVAMLFAMLIPEFTLKKTGMEYGNKDHSTVNHALKTCVNLYDMHSKFRSRINYIRDRFGISEYDFNEHITRWRK